MSITALIRQSHSLGGFSFTETKTLTADAQNVHEVSVPAAQSGTLSTRSSDSVGELTMDESAHTITTGDRVTLFWAGGVRRDVTVGTVAAAAVPISGGSGDVLPTADTVIYVSIPEELDVSVDGDNVVALLAYLSKEGIVEFEDLTVSEVEITYWNIAEAASKTWHNEDGDTNPFTSAVLGRVYFSHKDTTAAATARLGIAYDNAAG